MDYYSLPVSTTWLIANLKIIIGNRDLAEIMQFGDLWRSRGHKPLVHVVSPAMDGGKMWDKHKDPSGLLANIPAHIDMFIVDFYNRDTPELPKAWEVMTSPPKWLLWEYQPGKIKFNGTYKQFVNTFGVDPSSSLPEQGAEIPEMGNPQDSTISGSANILIHLRCPHCGKLIY